MPYRLMQHGTTGLYWVVSEKTGRKHSHFPLPKMRAERQMRALYRAMGMREEMA